MSGGAATAAHSVAATAVGAPPTPKGAQASISVLCLCFVWCGRVCIGELRHAWGALVTRINDTGLPGQGCEGPLALPPGTAEDWLGFCFSTALAQ
eukprot:2613224-Pyramimonas_sp.AAC.1